MMRSQSQTGLTIVELVVVMMLTLMLTGLVMSFTLDFWGRTTSLQNSSDTLNTRQTVGDALRDSLNRAYSLTIQPSIPDIQTLATDPAQVEGTFWEPLHAVPKTVSRPATNQYEPIVYFMAPSVRNDRTPIMNGAQVFQDDFIIYLSGNGELRLRTLANPGASGNRVITTCTPGQSTAACPADKLLAQEVSSVSSRYFSRSGNLQNWESILNPDPNSPSYEDMYIGPDMPTVEVIEMTIGLERKATLKKSAATKNETTVRVALRNG